MMPLPTVKKQFASSQGLNGYRGEQVETMVIVSVAAMIRKISSIFVSLLLSETFLFTVSPCKSFQVK